MRFPRLRLPARGWRRWLAILGVGVGSLFLLIVMLAISLWAAFKVPAFRGWFFSKIVMMSEPATPEETPGKPGVVPSYVGPVGDARLAKSAADLYRQTNIWNIHLRFTASEWDGIQAQRIPPVPGFMNPDGTIILRNPKASRNGLAGVLGIDFPWSTGNVEFGGVPFTNAAVRFKGNGTFMAVVRSYRKSFKFDLGKHVKGQALAGRSIFNLGNLSADFTCLSDSLAYEYFRDAGVPAPRTAFARVFLSIAGVETNRLLGAYVMVENPDAEWARDAFGTKGTALFKPVTLDLFSDLGTNWNDYDAIYDPKTKISDAQKARVIEVAQWVTHASDEEFARRVGEFLDLKEVARFLAAEVLLSNFDGILANGQNFLFYLDSQTQRVGFIPWDLDHSWGEFPFMGTAEQREKVSIWQPWVGTNRFLARMMAVPEFRSNYRAALEDQLKTIFVPSRIDRRLDEVAVAVRPVIAEWSTNRVARFDQAVSSEIPPGPRDTSDPMDPHRATWQIKRFVAARAASVRDQLDGKSEGVVITRQPPQ